MQLDKITILSSEAEQKRRQEERERQFNEHAFETPEDPEAIKAEAIERQKRKLRKTEGAS